MAEIGKTYIWKPIDRSTGTGNTDHPWYGFPVTVTAEDEVFGYRISVNDFPNTNNPAYHNWFYAEENELIEEESQK